MLTTKTIACLLENFGFWVWKQLSINIFKSDYAFYWASPHLKGIFSLVPLEHL